jgi:hypothetical protein
MMGKRSHLVVASCTLVCTMPMSLTTPIRQESRAVVQRPSFLPIHANIARQLQYSLGSPVSDLQLPAHDSLFANVSGALVGFGHVR